MGSNFITGENKLMKIGIVACSNGLELKYKVVNQRGGRKKVMYDFQKNHKKINVLICV